MATLTEPAISPVIFGITGMGGYARTICNRLLEQSRPAADGSPPAVRLAAVCEPDLQTHAAFAQTLRDQGITVVPRYEDLLAIQGIEAVWLPLPIDLHRPFTE